MVKINKTLKKELRATIKNNFKRYLSLVAIIFLGVGFFVGMKSNAPTLQDTMAKYMDDYNYMDLEILSPIGITDEEINILKQNIPEISIIEGGYYEEDIVKSIDKDTKEEVESVVAVHSFNPEKTLNKVVIKEGKALENEYECIAEASLRKYYDIGDTIKIESDNLKIKEFKIVGFARSPAYISNDKGSSSLLAGKIEYFVYLHDDAFEVLDYPDIYTAAFIKLDTKYTAFTEKYNNFVNQVKEKISEVSDSIAKDRLNEIVAEKTKLLNDGEFEYEKQKADAEKQLADAKKQIEDAETQITSAESQILSDTEVDLFLTSTKNSLDSAKAQLDSSKATLDMAKDILSSITSTSYNINIDSPDVEFSYLKEKLKKLEETVTYHKNLSVTYKKELADNENKCQKLIDDNMIDSCYKVSDQIKQKINNNTSELEGIEKEIEQINKLISYIENFDGISASGGSSIKDYTQYVNDLEKQYNDGYKQYQQSLNEYNNAKTNLKKEMASARSTIASKKIELENAKVEYESKEKEVMVLLEQAEKDLDTARKALKQLKNSKWYIFTRNDSYGYSQYYDDVQRVDSLGKVLPIIFYLVAALVTVSTITRMAVEERGKIGTLKSLGYSNKQVMYKYVYYTFTAVVIGSILGTLVGTFIFPRVFEMAYSLLYFIPDIEFILYYKYIVLAFILSFISTVVVAIVTVKETLREKPYSLMRPKEQNKKGKTFLEKNKKLWKKLPFMKKVAYRNIVISISRSVMTILGVAGCTALIVASFGTRESVSDIIFLQYGKIFDISAEYFYKDTLTDYEMREEQERINSLNEIEKTVLARIEMVDFKVDGKTYSIYNVIPDSLDDFEQILYFNSTTSKDDLKLDNNGVILTEKIAKIIGCKVGDTIEYRDTSNLMHKVKVSGITENYIYHYMYMTQELYEKVNDSKPMNNSLFIKYSDGADEDATNNLINKEDKFSSYQSLKFAQESYDEIIDKFNEIIFVIIVSAGLLAFVVLYNLAKINISERLREIATLKVLGYKNNEVNNYINNEMTLLTIIGIILGLIMGYFLTDIVVTTCEIDNLMYYHGISYVSYIYAIGLTFIFSKLINWIVRKDLKKINMIESLKSIE